MTDDWNPGRLHRFWYDVRRRFLDERWLKRGGVRLVLLLVLGGSVTACGGPSVSLDEDPSAYRERVRELEGHLSDNPDDGTALRELGTIYMRTGRPSEAYSTLKKAYSQRPRDPQVQFYLGLASEKVGRRQAALKLFRRFDEVPEDSKYRTLMEGRYEWLVRQQAQKNVQEMLAQEDSTQMVSADEVSPRVVAVMPFEYEGSEDQYAVLGRGLAEMVTTDLSHVNRLKVVERVRLQAIMDELKLAQSEYVDPESAPRVGRLMGAGRLVGGTYFVAGGEELRLNVTLVDVTSAQQSSQLESQRGDLDQLFALQKELSFSIIDRLNVELTAQEQAAIEEVPTQNLQAFLAYSRGLMEEDRGNYGVAIEHYQEAQQLDPNFEAPARRLEKAEGLQAASGSQGQVLANVPEEDLPTGQPAVDLVQQRLQSMGIAPSTESEEQEGDDVRDPAQEGTVDEGILLPEPPSPPSSDGGT